MSKEDIIQEAKGAYQKVFKDQEKEIVRMKKMKLFSIRLN